MNELQGQFEEALDRTITLLWPPKPGVWIRIAIIALFLGGGITDPFRTDSLRFPAGSQTGSITRDFLSGYADILIFAACVLLAAGLIYVIISSLFQFIFVDCVSTNRILLTRTMKLRIGKGIHLLAFYLLLLLIILFVATVVSLFLFVPLFMSGTPDIISLLITTIQALIILLIILIPVWIIAILAADFVVPVMIVDDSGLLTGWKQVLSLFQAHGMQVMKYTGFKILMIIITGIILGIILFLVSIPLGFTGATLTFEDSISTTGSITNIFPAIMGITAMILISLLLLVPVITFFRYYSLIILRDFSPEYNLLPPL